MDRMVIPNNPKTKKNTLVLIAALCCFVYVNTLAFEVAQTSSGIQLVLTWGFATAMAVFTLRLFALLFEKRASHLVASKPPVFVTTTTWFGKLTIRKCLEIKGAAWVRTRRFSNETDVLLVEVGTYGYQTTTIICNPYSESNIPIATSFCSDIAKFLMLEDKGYVNYA